MSWQLLILASVFLAATSTLLQRVLLKDEKSDPVAYSIFFQLLCGLFIAGFGLLFADMSFPSNISSLSLNIGVMVLAYGLGNIFVFRALKSIEASRFTVIFASRALFTVLASSVLLQEELMGGQFLGVLLIIAGVILVNVESAHLSFSKNELIALLAATSFGFANTNDRILLQSFKVYPYVTFAFILPALSVALLRWSSTKKIAVFLNWKLLQKMIILCIVYAASAITFFTALQQAPNSSLVASINLTSVVLTVLLSIIFLKERKSVLQKLLGAGLGLAGLLLLR